MAQSAGSDSATTSRSKPVRDIQMSVSIPNNVIAKSSEFVVTLEVTNSSTNILLVAETAPEGIFTVSLVDEFKRTFQLTRTPSFYTRSLVSNLKPGQSRTWRILAGVNKYFEPPGLSPAQKDVPPGDYVFRATGNFRLKDGRDVGLGADLKVKIK
jgi:hypothetical protein